jgi:hypothetical protein
MAKLDWLFLPVDIDDYDGEEGARRLPVRKLNRLHPQPNEIEVRSKASFDFERRPGSSCHKMKVSLNKRR